GHHEHHLACRHHPGPDDPGRSHLVAPAPNPARRCLAHAAPATGGDGWPDHHPRLAAARSAGAGAAARRSVDPAIGQQPSGTKPRPLAGHRRTRPRHAQPGDLRRPDLAPVRRPGDPRHRQLRLPDRRRRRLRRRLGGQRDHALRRRGPLLPLDHPGDDDHRRQFRPALGPEPAPQRLARGRAGAVAGIRAGDAGAGALDQDQRVRHRRPIRRRLVLARPDPPHPAQHRRPDHRQGDPRRRRRDRVDRQPQLHRPRRRPPDPGVGRDDQSRIQEGDRVLVDVVRARHRHHVGRDGPQLLRRRAARRARPPAARPV
ncbi:MAG: Dipeptide transport system permease protein DppC, partial [uncultured Thermomicrobiales bacterium]